MTGMKAKLVTYTIIQKELGSILTLNPFHPIRTFQAYKPDESQNKDQATLRPVTHLQLPLKVPKIHEN